MGYENPDTVGEFAVEEDSLKANEMFTFFHHDSSSDKASFIRNLGFVQKAVSHFVDFLYQESNMAPPNKVLLIQ